MNKKSRLLSIFLVIVVLIALVGCTQEKKILNDIKSDPNISDASISIQEKVVNIVVVVKDNLNADQAVKTAEKHAGNVKKQYADKAVNVQIKQKNNILGAVSM